MKIITLPEKERWEELCRRPEIDRNDLENVVRDIINRVKSETDKAVYCYSEKFDGVPPGNLKVSLDEISESAGQIPEELKECNKYCKKEY